jgi:uncharacterized glyoxalase superfamily protein PhnB
MTETPAPTVWPALRYDDAPAAVRFLVDVVGFREALVVPGEDGSIEHAELRWPEGGAVMFGSVRPADAEHADIKPGTGSVYVVSDRVDEIHARVRASDAKITVELHDTDFGSHTFSFRDAEGNSWTVGTYRGAAEPTP